MNRIEKKLLNKSWISSYLLFLIVIVSTTLNYSFLSVYNIQTILVNAIILFSVAAGQTFPILTGGIDLSVGGVISILSVIAIFLLPQFGYITFPIVLIFGTIIGALNGILLTKGKIPSFIATLGIGGICASIASTISPSPLTVPLSIEFYTHLINGKFLGIKTIYFWGVIITLSFLYVQYKTIIGKKLLFLGSNEKMAYFSGISPETKSIAFILSGLGSALTAIFLVSTLYSGYATIGNVYILNSISSVIIGGTALTGGRGGVVNTIIGVLILSSLTNGMTIIEINIFIQQTFLGFVVILTVILSTKNNKNIITK